MSEGFTGISFPFRIGTRGVIFSTTMMQSISHIEESIKQILMTAKGERVHQPLFGSDLNSYIFHPVDEGLYGIIDYEIRRALNLWEPRITIQDISFISEDSYLNVVISFLVNKYEGNIFSTEIQIV